MEKTLIINHRECEKILTVDKCIPAMEKALAAVSDGKTKMLQRVMIGHENKNSLAVMPASDISSDVTGAKIIIFPGPETARAKTNQGIIPLFEISSGRLKAIVDAELITVVRTAATSARATKALARRDSSVLAVLGCGRQGRAHAGAMIAVRPIEQVYMWDISPQAAQQACERLKKEYPGVDFSACDNAQQAVENADIICTTTPGKSREPVLRGRWLKDGCHINAVGACSASGRELDGEAVAKSSVFTDWNEAVLRDAGDILLSAQMGEISCIPPLCEVGNVISIKRPEGKITGK